MEENMSGSVETQKTNNKKLYIIIAIVAVVVVALLCVLSTGGSKTTSIQIPFYVSSTETVTDYQVTEGVTASLTDGLVTLDITNSDYVKQINDTKKKIVDFLNVSDKEIEAEATIDDFQANDDYTIATLSCSSAFIDESYTGTQATVLKTLEEKLYVPIMGLGLGIICEAYQMLDGVAVDDLGVEIILELDGEQIYDVNAGYKFINAYLKGCF